MKSIAYRSVVVAAAAMTLLSCAASRQFVPLATDNTATVNAARVYVLRPSLFGAAIPFAIYSDSTKVGKIGPKGYLCWYLNPGNHVLTIGSETKKNYPLMTKAGESYYFKAVPQMGLFIARATLRPMSSEEVEAALAKSREPAVR